MEMTVHLHPEIFDLVSQGEKDVEIRVNDLKRRKLKVGDILIFLRRPEETKSLKVLVKNLVYFSSFQEVCEYYQMKRIYLPNTSIDEYIELMRKFYSDDDVSQYGVVAIEFEKINEKYEKR